ncbi:MAG TPA: hypothetical protein VGO53_04435, partial [Steroidobacteraceae bacterium]|nr:hypothetical protein [Steroidobacteraceae bacterium]
MIREGRKFGFALGLLATCQLVMSLRAAAGDKQREPASPTAAPLSIPHTTDLELAARANRKHAPGNIEKPEFLEPTPGLVPLTFPKNSDVRARLLTPELRRTPLVGWIATNLYRGKNEKGWCLEADPGQGEYIVFYR